MKIKRKNMNKIQNEMRRRFGPYWERKNQEIGQLQRAVVTLQKEVQALNEFKANTLRAEASAGDTGKHVAKPEDEAPQGMPAWEARFSVFGGDAKGTIQPRYLPILKMLGVEHHVVASTVGSGFVTIYLLPTRYPAKTEALQEQMKRLLNVPVKVHWRKV